ncbi:MAG: hypothetical protein AzoDbin1_03891 [Azoarcus sp.]|nr:hypothetical protein [Azoarcus sp.]
MSKQVFNGEVSGQVAGGDITNKAPRTSMTFNGPVGQVIHGDVHNVITAKVRYRFDYATGVGPEHLDDLQKGRLRELVNEIVRIEATVSNRPKKHAAIWSALTAKAKVPSYHRIPASKFERAEHYLQTWLARLRAQEPAREKDPNWRGSRYAYIHAALREIGRLDDLPGLLEQRYSGRALKELGKLELETVYRIVAEWKKQARQKGDAM